MRESVDKQPTRKWKGVRRRSERVLEAEDALTAKRIYARRKSVKIHLKHVYENL